MTKGNGTYECNRTYNMMRLKNNTIRMGLKNNKNMQTCVSLFFFVFFTELVVCSLDMFQAFFLLLTLLQPILLQELQVLSVGPV